METELSKLIYQQGDVTNTSIEYLTKVFNELKQVNFFDHDSEVMIHDNPRDFFYGIAVALEVISENELGEVFTEDEDELYKIKGIKPLMNDN